MKFSIVTDMLGADSFDQSLISAKELGFEYIDLRAKLDGDTIDSISLEKARNLNSLIQNHGLKVASLGSWSVNRCTFTGPSSYDNYDDKHHKEMSEVLDRLFDLADIFSALFVRVYALHRKENFELLSDEEQEQEYKHNAEVMLKHAGHAQKRGKTLVLENEPPTLTSNCEELGTFIKYAKHPNMKINWDIINGWRSSEYPTIEKYNYIKGHVYQTHLKGALRLTNSVTSDNPYGRFSNFAIAGEDDFDHGKIMKEIAIHDPNAIMTIDTHYPSFSEQDKIGEFEAVRLSKEFFEQIL